MASAQKAGEGTPMPGVHAVVAMRNWAMSTLVDFLRASGQPTDIIGDFDLQTVAVHAEVEGAHDAAFLALVIEADTLHGGHFRQGIPWTLSMAGTLLEVVQQAGGVIHA
jgi:hypothetical protein